MGNKAREEIKSFLIVLLSWMAVTDETFGALHSNIDIPKYFPLHSLTKLPYT